MQRITVGRLKNRYKSNANEANDPEVEALLAQAESIKDNPDAVLAKYAEAEIAGLAVV